MKIMIVPVFLALAGMYRPSGTDYKSTAQDELANSMARGKDVYGISCAGCHQVNGEGLSGVFPPLANSDHLTKVQGKLITIILKGQNEEITVNNTKYSTPMAALDQLTDQQVADVLNYIGNSWGNQFSMVTPSQVKEKRE